MLLTAAWMDTETVMLSKVIHTEKDKYHILSLRCEFLKNDTNELIYKTETDSDFKTNLWLPNGKGKH